MTHLNFGIGLRCKVVLFYAFSILTKYFCRFRCIISSLYSYKNVKLLWNVFTFIVIIISNISQPRGVVLHINILIFNLF